MSVCVFHFQLGWLTSSCSKMLSKAARHRFLYFQLFFSREFFLSFLGFLIVGANEKKKKKIVGANGG